MTEKTYSTDIVIIGAGPTGLFSVFECGMLKMKCHVIDSLEEIGGQCTALYPEKPIYDIPAYPSILANELIEKLEEQAKPFNPTYHLKQKVSNLKSLEDGRYEVTTSNGTIINCLSVIIAAGAGAFGPNRPPLENLERYEGTSVFYMVKRRQDFENKTIVIAGGGDSAVDWAISLSEIAKKVYVIHRRDKFRAAPETVDQLRNIAKTEKLDLMIPYQLSKLHGENGLIASIEITDMDGHSKDIEADILLPFFGITPELGVLENWGLHIEQHQIPVNPETQETNLPGVFAVGDIVKYPNKLKLILTGFSEAAMAAHAARNRAFPDQELHFVHSTTQGIS